VGHPVAVEPVGEALAEDVETRGTDPIEGAAELVGQIADDLELDGITELTLQGAEAREIARCGCIHGVFQPSEEDSRENKNVRM